LKRVSKELDWLGMATPRRHNAWNEVFGLISLGLGTVLFLALISYTAADVPGWVWFSYISPTNNPAHNFIGPAGAIVAGGLYWFFGAAAYLIASVFLGFGIAKIFINGFRIAPRLIWVVVFLLTGAAIVHLQPWVLRSWTDEFKILGPGGWSGDFVGRWTQLVFGQFGGLIVLAGIYLVSLIWLTGIRPVHTVRQTIGALSQALRRLADERERKRLAAADEHERLETERRRVEKEIQRQQRELKKHGLPEEVRPAAKIVDATSQTAAPSRSKTPAPRRQEPPPVLKYQCPSLELLSLVESDNRKAADPAELKEIQNVLIDTLKQFNIGATPGDITRGPTITRYEVYPARGVRVDKIVSLERDLARATRAERINILAPIPGKDTVGIEIANSRKVKVVLREILESEDWIQSKFRIPIVLGKDVYGKIVLGDLAQMPHCLVAGTTGSGKSVCINAIVASILYRFSPDDLRFVMIDPKVVEMQIYNSLPHLIMPVVTDPKKVLLALRWVINEMEKRYKIFAKTGVRNITGFNARPQPRSRKELEAAGLEETRGESAGSDIQVPRDDEIPIPAKLPFIVVIIDELADLMQTAPADVETAIARITQMARAAGIHMIVATQTPRADIVTGVIKANIPTRIAFQVASALDSRVILDENGAERLLGQGDMFYRPPGTSRLVRSQGVLVTDEEIHQIVEFASAQGVPHFDANIQAQLESSSPVEDEVTPEDEDLVTKCLEIIRQEKKASTSMLQRRLRLGYTRAARIVDILERRGIVGPGEGAKPREILVNLDDLLGTPEVNREVFNQS
jgi:DNA segregation ATPase FtsK/SpoIIIE, S-DNA-T family